MTTDLVSLEVLNEMIARFGAVRATEASQPQHAAHHPPKWGWDGVDRFRSKDRNGDYRWGRYRARISFEDSHNGEFSRVTLGTFDNARDAGRAYIAAHIALWGSASRYATDDIVDYVRERAGC